MYTRSIIYYDFHFRITHFDQSKNLRVLQLNELYHFECKCKACENDYLTWHHKDMPSGKISDEIYYLSEVSYPILNMEFSRTDEFCSVLEKYDHYYPCLSMYHIGLKLHRVLILKFGNLSTELQVILSKFFWQYSCLEYFTNLNVFYR